MLEKFKEQLIQIYLGRNDDELQKITDEALEKKSKIIKDTLLFYTKDAEKILGATGGTVKSSDPSDDPILKNVNFEGIFRELLNPDYKPPRELPGMQLHLKCLLFFYDYVLPTLGPDHIKTCNNVVNQYVLLLQLDVAFARLVQAVGLSHGVIEDRVFHIERTNISNKPKKRERDSRQEAIVSLVKGDLSFAGKSQSWKADKVIRELRKADYPKIPSKRTILDDLDKLGI